ncbi:MAG: rhodanese-like domain-containing protein [Solirubrobacterales bacterium]
MAASDEQSYDLEPKRVAEMVGAGDAQLVDVRQPHEWEVGAVAQSLRIELDQLTSRAAEIDKDRPVIFICRVGNRSGLATDAFRASGYDAYNARGGVEAWAEAGLPLESA